MYVRTNVSAASVDACAKINLTLEVLGRRDDGYHELRSLVIGIGLLDSLRGFSSVAPEPLLQCTDPELAGPGNLAYRAAVEIARYTGRQPTVRIQLDKVIPVGGGLGGGSSDAAAALRLCDYLWDTGVSREALAEIGSRIGSDVPLFFSLPSAVITGRGECVERVALQWSGWVLLVFTGPNVSTADVYRAWRRSDSAALPTETDEAIRDVTTAADICHLLTNHLEAAVFRVSPRVARVYDELDRSGFGPLRVSGAGSVLYRLFDEREAACEIGREIEKQGIEVDTMVVGAPVGESPVVRKEE